ncbi:hypothetical protein PAMP_019668 [Pampus punctatissimus]
MGGCHSYPSATKADSTALQPSNINNEKQGINNNNLEERPYLEQQYVCQRVTHTDMNTLTALPPGVDKAEWLASNTVSFFKHINLFSSALSEFCTPSTCPTACGPGSTTLAHIYWSHYRETLTLGLHPHLNTIFTHLTLFCQQHALLEPEDTEPLQDLITALGQQEET